MKPLYPRKIIHPHFFRQRVRRVSLNLNLVVVHHLIDIQPPAPTHTLAQHACDTQIFLSSRLHAQRPSVPNPTQRACGRLPAVLGPRSWRYVPLISPFGLPILHVKVSYRVVADAEA